LIDAVPNLARVAAHRIAAGALNGYGVAHLARQLGVSDRHLRRVMERELGVSPLELAQTHRLLLAKRLLADTSLPVTRIAYASGFQSLRRFNSVFRERYRLSPSALRRGPRASPAAAIADGAPHRDLVRLTLSYRAPLAWDALLALLGRGAVAGVERREPGRYSRTVRVEGRTGIVQAADAAGTARSHLEVSVSASLLPVLMPLLARLRHLFDLDAEPTAVDTHLHATGLGALVARCPGLRIPGAVGGFDAVFRIILGRRWGAPVAAALGEPIETGVPGLDRLMPEAEAAAAAGAGRLEALGVPGRRAEVLTAVARALASGAIRLEPGSDVAAAQRSLLALGGVGERLATTIVMHALHWPDAFPACDRALQRAAGASTSAELRTRAEAWRPWRAYAATHLRLVRPALDR
jgi:AraC family transcriptional regulator of adaptative response / DNA-3-methyladenine glycosylase II